MKERTKGRTLSEAALKASISEKTARKYLNLSTEALNQEKLPRQYQTRPNPFESHIAEIADIVTKNPKIQAATILEWLKQTYPEEEYTDQQLRTLQRKLKQLRLAGEKNHGDVKFRQTYAPGQMSQSDWTNMNEIGVSIQNKPFKHLLFHMVLCYSGFETIWICESESFESLATGYERAALEMGGTCQIHRTDNLSAATQASGNTRQFTARWKDFMEHYGVEPSRNNPGESHENGKVEKSHDLFKNAVRQNLMLRGSKNFFSVEEYAQFLNKIKDSRNWTRRQAIAQEQEHLRPLPEKEYNEATIFRVRVTPESFVHILGVVYSVPSRLISQWLKAYVYRKTIHLYLGASCVLELPRLTAGAYVNYRHIIESLLRKPGAFEGYQYQQHLFPNAIFRKAYDVLRVQSAETAAKEYCRLLLLAKNQGESRVEQCLKTLLSANQPLDVRNISTSLQEATYDPQQIHIMDVQLADYDALLAQEA